ncbi:hypothetical protein C1H87_18585 [Flavivirga eckloniae]|uniref:Uncharacterized protein n=2 Tax=Flavivirga eckloniae TaxID=1803846 RepID=A0A2K9PU90_9FLAO|nr:hypothetical protein C1H87_18585 [Flavivirga eckloniae]
MFHDNKQVRKVKGNSLLKNCKVIKVNAEKISEAVIEFHKVLRDTLSNSSVELKETFTVSKESLNWVITVLDAGEFWSTPIETVLQYPVSDKVKLWAPWGDPRGDTSGGGTNNKQIADAIINSGDLSSLTSWEDPLVAQPVTNKLWHYGAPRYQYDDSGVLYCPFQGDVINMPMISFFEKDHDMGLSLILSPEDTLLDINLETKKDGTVKFSRFNHRIGGGKVLRFSMDLVPHQADWRSSLGWMVERYRSYFYPTNPLAKEISGTGAYSNSDAEFDVAKMKKMAFRVNWRASFDFPYMGMFIPPVDKNEVWSSFVRERGGASSKSTSISKMSDYSKNMDDKGFYVLNYFNVTEFGTQIKYPKPAPKKSGASMWLDANDYLYEHLADAMLFVPDNQKPVVDKDVYNTEPGKPFWTWEKAVVMDPGVKSYQDFLVDQANKLVTELPNSYGICINRMDWTRFYNHKTDDGVSWMGDQPVGSMYVSWMKIMEKLDPVFHDNNKVIYANNHVKRIEQLKYVDGLFDEFTYAGASLNAVALLGNQKPVLGWISNDKQLTPDSDEVMQKFLYMGVFPMAPFPENDHSIRPSKLADKVYLDYGPLFNQLRGKEWVLEPHVISTKENAKVNLFKSFGGYTIPITHVKEAQLVEVRIKKKELVKNDLKVYAYHPGDEDPIVVPTEVVDGELKIVVPIKRGCAVLKINKAQ